jgi:hypothetical protein
MATTRLRRTFAYPTESDSDDPPDLDEEHQEQLLTTLQSQDEATSNLYRHLFLALPVLTSLAYVPAFAWASGATETVVVLLSVVVPALAAWILWAYPIKNDGEQGLRSLGSGGESGVFDCSWGEFGWAVGFAEWSDVVGGGFGGEGCGACR